MSKISGAGRGGENLSKTRSTSNIDSTPLVASTGIYRGGNSPHSHTLRDLKSLIGKYECGGDEDKDNTLARTRYKKREEEAEGLGDWRI